MEPKMFCFQCEQTAGCTGCLNSAGACGKTAELADLQDKLTGALITLAQLTEQNNIITDKINTLIVKCLFATITNVNFDKDSIQQLIDEVHNEIKKLTPNFNFKTFNEYNMRILWNSEEDVRSLKSLILFGIRGMAAYAYHAEILGYTNDAVNKFFTKALNAIANEANTKNLLSLALETGKHNYACMEMLDRANTETYGSPVPAEVSLKIEKGPFIIISGHDLYDLKQLLEQTKDTGINIYTHGEMLPAHAYPKLKQYRHLKGHFGTAWHNQQKEFDNLPAPVLFTTNCLMPPALSYQDRIFTTEMVGYPGITHIGSDKNFTPIIEKALQLGGYDSNRQLTGINGGTSVTTGFGHNALLTNADKIVQAVQNGAIRHFFLVGGCDGARPSRSYYTDFVKLTPSDTVVLTLGCGKYRFNDLNLGTIGNLPRLMDLGQCNDAFSAIKIASELARAFNCGINDLPLSLIISWYEQKAVCILLTLLYLGVKNIRLGPTLPAFLSPNILHYLAENYNISAITAPEKDLKNILG